MRTRTKVVLGAAVASAALITGGWLSAPTYIKYRVNETPGVTVESVSLHAWHIELHQVTVERPSLWATLPSVTVDTHENITINGGNVVLDKKAATEPASGPKRKIAFKGLHVTLNGVMPETPIDLENVSGTPEGDITIEKATGRHPTLGRFSAEKVVRSTGAFTSGAFRAETVEVHDFRPLPMDPCKVISLKGIVLAGDRKSVHVETVVCGGNRADGLQVGWEADRVHARVDTLVVTHPWLHPVPLVLSYPVHVDWDKGMLGIFVGDSYPEAKLGAVVNLERKHMDITGDCAEIAARLPLGLAEPLNDIEFKGALDIHILWDPKDPDVTVKGRCTAVCSSPRLQALRRPFKYRPYASDWTRKERQSGPGSRDWVPLPMVATAMPTAAIALEDPGFLHHRGWIAGAFRNSLKMNLEKGRFAHGGSTLTMQLAKNLWLTRDKTFGRKTQELLLASALESCFSKDEILELYLNVIEYGPDLYGIGPASEKWFHTSPSELTPRQAFWLASILPRPRKAVQPDEAVLARTEQFVKKLVEAGRVPETMLETVPEGALDGW